jgi:hypothetical protein
VPEAKPELVPITEIILPLHDTEAIVMAFNAAGEEMEIPARLVIQPFFPRPASSGMVAYLTARSVTADDLGAKTSIHTHQRATLRLSGQTGRLTINDRTRSITPSFMNPEADPEE